MVTPVLQSIVPYRLRGMGSALGSIYIFFFFEPFLELPVELRTIVYSTNAPDQLWVTAESDVPKLTAALEAWRARRPDDCWSPSRSGAGRGSAQVGTRVGAMSPRSRTRIPADQHRRSLGGQGSNLRQPAPKTRKMPIWASCA